MYEKITSANVNMFDSNGFTPISVAAQQGHIEVIKVLTSLGADIHAEDNFTPCYFAAGRGHVEVSHFICKT